MLLYAWNFWKALEELFLLLKVASVRGQKLWILWKKKNLKMMFGGGWWGMLEGQGALKNQNQPNPKYLTGNLGCLQLFVAPKYLPASGLPKERT